VTPESCKKHRRQRFLQPLCVAILAAAGASGCTNTANTYGADQFVRISDTQGLPTYKATTNTDKIIVLESDPDVARVVQTACPDGHPHVLDGDFGMAIISWQTHNWWSVTFTCDHEIPLSGGAQP
jgi:hypothetical protein